MRTSCLILFAALGLQYGPLAAQMQVSGEIGTDVTWPAPAVQVTGDVHIARDVRVTIEPGTRVEFQGHYVINVDGTIIANGTAEDSIIFTINDATGFSNKSVTDGSWNGIRFNPDFSVYDNTDTSYFRFCRIEYTKYITSPSYYVGAGISVIYNYEAVIRNCTFQHHFSQTGAGGVSSFGSDLIIRDNLFRDCEGYRGGAVGAIRGFPVVENNTIINNRASQGAGVWGRDSNIKIRKNLLRGNQATQDGGAIYFTNTDGQISGNQVVYNSAGQHGGGIYFEDNSSASITANFISNNLASSEGGGLYCDASSPDLVNNCVVNNTASVLGGGLYLQDFNSILMNNTIAHNYTPGNGGGLYLQLSSPILYNTILWNNYGVLGRQVYLEDQFSDPDFYNCNLNGGLAGISIGSGTYDGVYENSFELNPLFKTPTAGRGYGFDATAVDWGLQTYSPCINTGAQDDVPLAIPAQDLAGSDRIMHGLIDVGAYEAYNPYISTCGTISTNTTFAADSVFITCDLIVSDNVILTIAPGTVVVVDTTRSIQVNGTLVAEGDPDRPIVFTVADTNGFSNQEKFSGGWGGILFDNESLGGAMYDNDTSRFSYCRFEFAKGKAAVQCRRYGGVVFNQCRFSSNSGSHGGGIYGYFSNLNVRNSLFELNRTNDLYPADAASCLSFDFSSPLIANNEFRNNYGNAISASSCNGIRIRDNLIYNSMGGNGISFNSCHNTIVTGNRVFNSFYDFVRGGYGLGISLYHGNHYLANNLVCNCGSIGVSFVECDPSYLVNNTIANNSSWGVNLYSTELYAYNNIVYGNNSEFNDNGVLHELNNFLENPGFRSPTTGAGSDYDASEGDWTLLPVSPAIDLGTTATPGTELPGTDLAGNDRVWNELVDIGAYESQAGIPVITRQPSNVITCGGAEVSLSVQTRDTAYFQWKLNGQDIPGANSPVLDFGSVASLDQGNYVCQVSNSFGLTESNPAYLFINLAPEILTEPTDTWVQKDKRTQLRVDVTGSPPMSFQWQKDGSDIPGATSPELKIPAADYMYEGGYSCVISNSCGTVQSNEAMLYLAPEICMVTVDEESGFNLVVWEKNSIAPVSAYNIYRESTYSGIYDLIGTVLYDDLSEFTDSAANPAVQAYLYKITALDENGNETDPDLCRIHKTIHLLASINPETKATQLDWDRYVGFDYGTYNIYRSDSTFQFEIVHSMASSTSTWADTDPGKGTKYYRIGAVKEESCNPTGNTKAGTGPYTHALSNLDDNKLKSTGMEDPALAGSLSIYPNPMKDYATLQFPASAGESYVLTVRDLSGKPVVLRDKVTGNRIELKRGSLAPGIYLIELKGASVYRGRLVVQ